MGSSGRSSIFGDDEKHGGNHRWIIGEMCENRCES